MQAVPHRQPFHAHPLVQLAAAFAAGILGSHFLNPAFVPLLGCSLLAALLALVAALKQRLSIASASITIAFLLTGACATLEEKQAVPPHRLKEIIERRAVGVGEPVELTGVLERPPELASSSFYITLRVEQLRLRGVEQDASGVVSLLLPLHQKTAAKEYERLELRYGARVRIMTALGRANNFRNPGVSSFTEYLERKGYDATGVVKSPLLIERLSDERVFLPLAGLYAWREQLQGQIISHFSPQTAGILMASLLGNRYFLSQSAAERFREGGTFHVLVISGMHISFIGGLVIVVARRLTKKRGWQFVFSITVLWGYALAVGAEASVVRAAFMFTVVAFAPVVARLGTSLNALGAAALALLVWRPENCFDPSFQLTFLSVLAIVVVAWPLLASISKIGSWRPTRETPFPPTCKAWLRSTAELLFWSERNWRHEMAQLNYSYKLFKTPMAAKLERYHLQGPLRYGFEALVVSLSVQATLLPLFIVYFHRVSLSSIVLNIGVSILMALVALTAIIGLIIAQVSPALAAHLFSLTNAINWLMVHSVDPFARLGLASLRLPEYSGWAASIYGLYYVPLLMLAISISRWKPLAGGRTRASRTRGRWHAAAFVHLIVVGLLIAHPRSGVKADRRLHVDFLDVGQGDAALVTLPEGTTLLVDAGGRPTFQNQQRKTEQDPKEPFERDTRSIGEAVVSEHLWWRGLDRVDYIIATHADADHINGLNDIARNFTVGAALAARTPKNDPEFAEFAESLRTRGIPLTIIGAGDVLHLGGVAMTMHWPLARKGGNAASGNNDSIVLQLRFGERKILLTGDVEKEGESMILSAKNDLRSDVVKVAHHGSRSSSTEGFVAATKPAFAIISVGQRSVFGHPHHEVVERWQTNGAVVLTTGKSGMITVTTNGRDLKVMKFVEE